MGDLLFLVGSATAELREKLLPMSFVFGLGNIANKKTTTYLSFIHLSSIKSQHMSGRESITCLTTATILAINVMLEVSGG